MDEDFSAENYQRRLSIFLDYLHRREFRCLYGNSQEYEAARRELISDFEKTFPEIVRIEKESQLSGKTK